MNIHAPEKTWNRSLASSIGDANGLLHVFVSQWIRPQFVIDEDAIDVRGEKLRTNEQAWWAYAPSAFLPWIYALSPENF